VPTPLIDGEDGVQYWVLSRDPVLVRVPDVKPYLDRPPYRADRVVYPLLAAPLRLVGEKALLWGLLITNVLAAGVGTWAAARIARNWGGPGWAGLTVALCPGIAVATLFDTIDVLAIAFLLLALLGIQEGRWAGAIVAASAAVLTKEVFVLGIVGLAVFARSMPLRRRVQLILAPSAAFAGWALYVRARLGAAGSGTGQDLTAPLSGYFRLLFRHGLWATDRVSQELAALVLILALGTLVAWWRRRSMVLSAAAPFALLTLFLGPWVLGLLQNSLRVVAPLLTLVALDALVWSSARADATTSGSTTSTAMHEHSVGISALN
jgi:hypothetical protein